MKVVKKISYKAALVGIEVLIQEESYMSKCSFLDQEPIGKRISHGGKRLSRGRFRSAKGTVINADVNGVYNIMRNAIPNSILDDGIEDAGLHPVLIAV